jgi:hypothetical protein
MRLMPGPYKKQFTLVTYGFGKIRALSMGKFQLTGHNSRSYGMRAISLVLL